MALHCSYKNRFGHYTYKFNGKPYKVWFCQANALCAMIHFYREEREGKRVDMVQLMGFFGDLVHARNCIKDADFFKNCTGFTFFANELTPDMWKLVKMMSRNGIQVTLK